MRLLIFALVYWSFSSVFAAPPESSFDISVKFDHTFYELKYDLHVLNFSGGSQHYRIEIKDCNRTKIEKITKTYQSLLSQYLGQPPRQKIQFDVEVSDSQGKNVSVARGSPLGTWLRELPAKMMYHNAEALELCKH